ncbi:MAG: TetR/AcrR family transcriptional regulator [Propionibacterium sp.]|nr:TetR/AcrR family transcriptional regulator [Propionibacterium sp.]
MAWVPVSRATPLPRDERRAAIVDATLPLLEAHGDQLTSRQVADAAGVAEGTIFRAFDSLQDVIDATITEGLSSARLLEQLRAEPFPGDLEGDLAVAMRVLQRYHYRIRVIIHISHASATSAKECARDQLTDRHRELVGALVERFAPHAHELAVSPESFVQFILIVAHGRQAHTSLGLTHLDADALIDLALTGARKDAR